MPSGTKLVRLSPASDGPFRCIHCEYFLVTGHCKNEQVRKDPEVLDEKIMKRPTGTDEDGNPIVMALECCAEYEPKKEEDKQQIGTDTLYLVRHGEVSDNAEVVQTPHRVRGARNQPLVDQGIETAHRVSEYFEYKPIVAIYSSDLDYTYDTAKIIAKPHNLVVHKERGLRTWDLGVYQGMEYENARAGIQWHFENPDITVPDGESYNDFYRNYARTLLLILRKVTPKGDIIAVVHGRNFGPLAAILSSRRMKPELLRGDIHPGTIVPINVKTLRIGTPINVSESPLALERQTG